MVKSFHSRFTPQKIPDDWRDESLYRAAIRVNKNDVIPAVFPQDSLDYLSELGYSLPRRGIMFLQAADEFIAQLAISVLAPCDVAKVNELRDILRRKEDAVADGDFNAAISVRNRQHEIQAKIARLAIHQVTRAEIVEALMRDGVTPEDDAHGSG